MEKRKLKITKRPSYIANTEGQKIFLSEIVEERKQEPVIWGTNFLKLLCVIGWVMFFISIRI